MNIIKSDLGFLCALVNGKARWSSEYPDAIKYSSIRIARQTLQLLPLTAQLTDAVVIQDYGLESETTLRPADDICDEDLAAGLEPGTLANDRRLAKRGISVIRYSSGAVVTQNSRGRCEDAPCCGCCS